MRGPRRRILLVAIASLLLLPLVHGQENATPPAARNLLRPTNNLASWQLGQIEGGKGTLVLEGDAVRVNVTVVDGTNWHVQLHQSVTGLQEGRRYILRFRARADAPRELGVQAQTGVPDFHVIGLDETAQLTTEYQRFDYTFTATKVATGADANLVPNFFLGTKTGSVWIANVVLAPAGGGAGRQGQRRQTQPAPPAPTNQPPSPPDTANPAAVPNFGEATFSGISFVKIPAGTFRRGTTDAQRAALEKAGMWTPMDAVEQPAREIRITRPFFLSKREITQAEWARVLGEGPQASPSSFKGPELPVETVSWNDVQTFLTKLNGAAGGRSRYRLPTEAEWEYACRAGSSDIFGMGEDKKTPITAQTLPDYAWHSVNASNQTHPVGTKKPNGWGLYDMHGGVWEWCQDGYSPTFYAASPAADPLYAGPATERVLRGGCWFLDARAARAALRGGNLPTFKSQYVGFRLVRTL